MDNDSRIKEENKMFLEYLTQDTPNILTRYQLIRGQEISHKVEHLMPFPAVINLYWEARSCYSFGLYYATIQVIASTMQLLLRDTYHIHLKVPNKGKKESFAGIINRSIADNIIDQDLGDRIHDFREYIRNPATHPRPLQNLRFLGMKEIDTGSWETPNGKLAATPEMAAEEGILCFHLLIKQTRQYLKKHKKLFTPHPSRSYIPK